jgi:ribose 5-phosphate isomerase
MRTKPSELDPFKAAAAAAAVTMVEDGMVGVVEHGLFLGLATRIALMQSSS